jgi:hypothetical protein
VENKRREVISLPNTTFSKQGVKNYSRGNEPVGFDTYVELTYDTPPNRVKAVIRETWRRCRWSWPSRRLASAPGRTRARASSTASAATSPT